MNSGSNPAVDAFLAHHGIKGMKWGVRRADPESDEHRAYRKAVGKSFRKETVEATGRRIGQLGTSLTPEDYAHLSDKEVRYRSGKTLKRLTTDAEADQAKKALFVSTNKADATAYRSILPYQDSGIVKGLVKGGNHQYDGFQESTYKATKALTGPSEKARVDAFVSLMDTPQITLRNGKQVTGREYLKRAGLGHDVRRLDSQRLGLKYYNDFTTTQWADTPISSAYFESLRQKGYNIVADDNDRHILTKDPIIILDPNGSVKQMSIRQLSTDDVLKAQSEYKDVKK